MFACLSIPAKSLLFLILSFICQPHLSILKNAKTLYSSGKTMYSFIPNVPLIFWLILALSSCSTIDKKDCSKDMFALGLKQGQLGSPRKYTDQIRNVCSHHRPPVELDKYEAGFKEGWNEFCRPSNALAMGKSAEHYISFCPENKEVMFREKYLIGKRINELKDMQEELTDELHDLRLEANGDNDKHDEIKKREKDLFELNRTIQNLEIDGLRDTLTLINHI